MWLGRVTKSWFPFINDFFGGPRFWWTFLFWWTWIVMYRESPELEEGREKLLRPTATRRNEGNRFSSTSVPPNRCWKMRANKDDDDWHDSVGGGRVSSPSHNFGWTSVAFSSPSSSFGLEQGIYEGTWIRALGERVSLHYSRRTNSQQQPVVGRSENWTGWALYVND